MVALSFRKANRKRSKNATASIPKELKTATTKVTFSVKRWSVVMIASGIVFSVQKVRKEFIKISVLPQTAC
jgi:hypothetical protein